MLEHETVSDDGVIKRVPLTHAYATAWAKVLGYPSRLSSDRDIHFMPTFWPTKRYYEPEIRADTGSVRVATPHWRFTLYVRTEPVFDVTSAWVGMVGEPIPPDTFDDMVRSVVDLPCSTEVASKLAEKMAFLDANPMYRSLPGIAARHETPAASTTETARPRDWD